MKEIQQNKILELFTPYVPKAVTSRILEGKPSLPSERREVTVIFLDIKDFTHLAERLDPEEATDILNRIFQPIINIIYKYEGSINKFLGDGLMIVFGAPYSHENDPERAVRASLEMMESIERNGEIEIDNKKIKLRARIGVNTGLCISGEIGSPTRKEFTIIGDTVNLASRLQTNVKPGEILVGEKTYQRVKDNFIFSRPHKLKIKGKQNLITAYIIKGIKKITTSQEQKRNFYSTFVGRKEEINILINILRKSYKSKGQIIKIIGELGVGKSRLIIELTKDKLAQNFNILSTDCSSWEQSKPYAPLQKIFYRIFEIKFEDDIRIIEKKIEEKINSIDSSLLFAVPYFSRLLSAKITPLEELMGKSREELNLFIKAATKLFLGLSIQKPVLLVVEDIQWLDDASLEFIGYLYRAIAEVPIFIICSFRKSLQKAEFLSEIKSLEILPLAKDESIKLIKSLIKDEEIFVAIKENIASASDGNPLFIEEITQGIESKKLADISHFQIPDTVQSIVSARIDLLPISSKEVLYQAAVMGRDFELSLFQKVTQIENALLLNILQELKNYEFILEKETYPRKHFSFKHSLIQEVAYNSLLYKTRKNLHFQVGLTIEKTFLTNLETKVEELAYHFKNSNHKEKGIFYLNKAGDKAQSLYAFKNAINYYLDSIKILESTEFEKEQLARLSEIYNKLAFSQSIIGERKESETNLTKALEYCRKIRDKDNESLILMNMGNLYGDMGKWDKAIEYFKRSLLISEEVNNLRRKARIIKSIGLAYLFKGDTERGYKYLKESLTLCESIKAEEIYIMVLNNMGIYYDIVGEWRKALEVYKNSLAISKKNNNIIEMSNTMGNLGFAYSSLNKSEQAIYYFKESIKISERIGDIYNKGINYIHLGEEYLRKDKFKEVKYYISNAEKIFKELEDKLGLADIFKLKAILCKKQKDWERSEEYFKRAIKIYSQQGDRLNEGETYYEWGDMSILKKDADSARKRLIISKKILGSIGARKHLGEIEEKLNKLEKY